MSRETVKIYIQGNERMSIPAQVAGYSFARWSNERVRIEPVVMYAQQMQELAGREGQAWLQGDVMITYKLDDLCSFMPTRMSPPTLQGFQGRCVVIDPDMFAVQDVSELFTMDMQGKAIWAAPPPEYREGPYETSMMLLDCSKLRHWDLEPMLRKMCAGELDYGEWERLRYEAPHTVGTLDRVWNTYDSWEPETRVLHNTNYLWWPWKRGRAVEYWEHRLWVRDDLKLRNKARLVVKAARRRLKAPRVYEGHPDPRQEQNFIDLLGEALECGHIRREEVQASMDKGHIRSDLLAVVDASRSRRAG